MLITNCVINGNNNKPSKNAPTIKLLINVANNQRRNPKNAFNANNSNEFNNAPPNRIGNAPRINSAIAPSNNNLAPISRSLLKIIKPIVPNNVKKLINNEAAIVASNARINGIAMFNKCNPIKLKIVSGNKSKKPMKPTINGNSRTAPISIAALIKSKRSLSNLSGKATNNTNAATNLLKRLSPGRIVHSGNVSNVPPNVNNSANSSSPPSDQVEGY